MEKVGKNFNQEWGNHIARQFRRAWNGQLPVEEFSRLLEPSFVFHFHGQIICGIPKYHDFIRQARQTTKNLDVIEEFVLSQDNLVLLFFRWSSEQWHQDVVAGGRLSNFCKVVFRVEDGKIAEIWEQAPDFLYLLGKIKQKEIMRYPLVIEENLLIQEKEGLYPANDPQTTMMSNLFKRMNDCFLGRSSLRNMKDIQNKDMTFYNGDTQGSGVEAWKTFAYALHSCLGSHSPKRFDDLYIRNGDELTVFLRANSEHESPYILRCANGLVASLKLKERDGKIQMLATHLENYIPFLDTDFSNHKTRIRDLFHGRREPVVEPVTGFDHPQRGKMKRVAVAASPESFDTGEEQVAIVGMAGRFPKCNSIEEYWEALVSKKNLFSETPPKRLYIQQGTKIRYAGFIDDVDLFDAPFFQILPSEAEYIDPQQRLLLEEIVQCIADSGHPSSDYSGPRTGLFVTTLSEDYKKLLQDKGLILSPLSWGGNEMAMFPPKIARFLNIQGPCHYINAECASSLVAIHEASSLIRQGSIDQAIIGATNLFLHPYGFAVREETLLTTEPFPRLFSKQSKGQLRGEAIVSVILKSLSKAIEDKDFIYGIVAGSAVNNSGKTLSLAAGNVEQQAKVITEAWGQANIQPSDVSLIECHASGVRGGDFAEIAAIKQAFNGKKGATDRKHVCHISSVKGAIGHAEAASGLTALVKLLLQLQHQQIVGTQGLEELDPELRIDPDRFNLVRDAIPWGSAEKSGTMQPRVAGINGFAVGGYNAHVVIQEFVPRREKDTSRYLTPSDSPPVDGVSSRPESNRTVIVLSAHAEPSLKAQLRNFRQYLYAHPSIDLEDLACTLQLGRDAMRYRAAFVVSSVDELIQQMGTVLESKPLPPQVFIGKKGGKRVGEMKGAERSDDQMDEVILQNDLLKIAERWSQGQAIPWSQLKRQKGRRLLAGLPLYPFDRKSYWVPETENRKTSSEEANLIHPLLHQNTSNVYLQRYRTVFTGKELFLSDHVVQGHKVLPGVAYLEMIRVAVRNALQEPTQTGSPREGGPSIQIRNIVWIQPIVVDAKNPSPVEVQVELFPVDYSEVELQPGGSTHQAVKTIAFEIYSKGTESPRIHCQGQATIRFNQAAPLVDLSALQAVCGQADLTSQQIYTAYQAMGLAYGPAYRGIESLQIGQDAKGAPQVLAKLTRPSVWKNHDEYVLHPSMMDSAVQAAIALVMDSGGVPSYQRPPLPFALEEVDIHHPCTSRMWAWVRFSASSDGEGAIGEDTRGSGRVQKIDIDVIDAYGKLCVRMARLSSRTSDKGTTKQFTQNSNDDSTSASSGTTNRIELDEMQEKVLDFLKHKVARILKVKPENIDIEEELNEYGFDSIHLTDFGNQLNEEYQLPVDRPLNPTIFFEYPTLKSVTGYLVREYRDFVREKYFGSRPRQKTSEGLPERTTPLADSTGSAARLRRPAHRFSPVTRTIVPSPSYGKTDIAIVGMSGRFPMANDVDEFWENLVTGKDCITEIPRDRWDWQALYGDPTKEPNKTNIKWGGFIEGIGDFDPLFFGISPREAELMDPQQRLLMLHIWQAIEDAGYSAQSLSGSKTAIFVGTANSGYGGLLTQANIPIEGSTATGMVPSVGPNRMSYFLNLHGPSEPIETACSSSLVAIHRAITAMETGACEMAIVGGVNTIVTPDGHIGFSKAGMLCKDGRCKTFSKQANGYVRGEGVGMLFLKKLSDAERCGDHIYGVFRGSAENHGGRANSLTAPNPKAQTELLKSAYAQAGIDPRSVGYIEAHGTGTELGDPIEINGLKAAFSDLYQATGDVQAAEAHCGLGSVKSNIGHLELAAGVAGVIKVLMQLKHKTLVKSLHCEEINPYIQLQGSPFYVVQETQEWKALRDSQGRELPRRAGVSSFGFGGANAHVVIEEYLGPVSTLDGSTKQGPRENDIEASGVAATSDEPASRGPYIIVLSAKSKKQLQEATHRLLQAVGGPGSKNRTQAFEEKDLLDIAYTLQVGREAMEERLAMIVSSLPELRERLQAVVAGVDEIENVYRGLVKSNREELAVFNRDEDLQQAIDAWVIKGKYKKLLELWVKGLVVDWEKLYGEDIRRGGGPRRIGLPPYPFAKERYWVPASTSQSVPKEKAAAAALHPLVHVNTSNLSQQRYSSIFSGEEFFLRDHVVMQHRLLPAVAYLEMVRAAVENALGEGQAKTGIRIKNVVWPQPIIAGDKVARRTPVRTHVALAPEDSGDIAFQIYTNPSEDRAFDAKSGSKLHCQGLACVAAAKPAYLDLAMLQAQCAHNALTSDRIYDAFQKMGMQYGPGHQGVEKVYIGEREFGQTEILAKLQLPAFLTGTLNEFVLHPCLMDSALQACIGFMLHADPSLSETRPPLPFRLKEIEILEPCTSSMWAWIRLTQPENAPGDTARNGDRTLQTLDIDLCDESGKICVRMKRFSTRVLPEKQVSDLLGRAGEVETVPGESPSHSHSQILMLTPTWEPVSGMPRNRDTLLPSPSEQTLIIGGTNEATTAIRQFCPNAKTAAGISKNIVSAMGSVNHIIWIAPDEPLDFLAQDQVIEDQDSGVLKLFRAIKTLLSLGYGTKKMDWTLITTQSQAVHKEETLNPTHAGLIGLAGSLAKEYSPWKIRVVDLPLGWTGRMVDSSAFSLNDIFSLPVSPAGNAWVYRHSTWYRQKLTPFRSLNPGRADHQRDSVYKSKGVYIVIGGAGGIGEVWSEYMIRTYQAQIIWIGRREKDSVIQAKLDRLTALGPMPRYIRADAAQREQLQSAYDAIKREHPRIHGIVHSAIVLKDQSLANMDEESFKAVLSTKVDVSVRMAQVFEHEPLDFVMFFSSLVSFAKPPGQSNYVAGCAFKDAIAHRLSREWPCAVKVMNWGFWGSVGVAASESYRQRMAQLGVGSLEPPEAMEALEILLSDSVDQTALVNITKRLAELSKGIYSSFLSGPDPDPEPEPAPELDNGKMELTNEASGSAEKVEDYVTETIKKILSDALKVGMDSIDIDESFSGYGLDSITGVHLAQTLNQTFAIDLDVTLFFDYSTVRLLSEYMLSHHADVMTQSFKSTRCGAEPPETEAKPNVVSHQTRRFVSARSAAAGNSASHDTGKDANQTEGIAVMGMSGCFPKANDLETFWNNLMEGKDCIDEVPEDRWDWEKVYGDPNKKVNTACFKWGGFIEGVENFDAAFFGISPEEAVYMSPQQRLLMTYVWKAMEDAGVTPKELSANPTGVFIATVPSEYMSLASISKDIPLVVTGLSTSMIPNRISYTFNLRGPSEHYDTACSSTLVALHRAIQSIYKGECEQAIVGAVNLLLTPAGYIGFESMGYLSPEGRAASFQAEANGFVRAEGVGAVLLKPLRKAIEDRNQIYAVIKGSGISHGGNAVSMTTPNGTGMKEAIRLAYESSGINPRTVSYIEAHGIASPLGDAIEMNALKAEYQSLAATFSENSVREAPCYIGSSKSCIGYGEVASGMAALIKVILAMRHRTLPGIPRFTTLHENIALKNSHFRMTAENQKWEALTDVNGHEIPRRAGINNYGFSGVNAHMVLEEYVPPQISTEVSPVTSPEERQMIVFSAKNPERLRILVQQMRDFVASKQDTSFENVAYTLQVGREAMDCRLAVLARDRGELLDGLRDYLDAVAKNGELVGTVPVLMGRTKDPGKNGSPSASADKSTIEEWLSGNHLENLAAHWVNGGKIPWERLHHKKDRQRISLPGYPLEQRRLWVEGGTGLSLIHGNISDVSDGATLVAP